MRGSGQAGSWNYVMSDSKGTVGIVEFMPPMLPEIEDSAIDA